MPHPMHTQEYASEKIAAQGYELIGEYRGNNVRVMMRCPVHNISEPVLPHNIFMGGHMKCCGRESMRKKLAISMRGEGNHFYGKTHTDETRKKISEFARGPNNPRRGVPMPRDAIEKTRQHLLGVPRKETTKQKLHDAQIAANYDVDYIIKKAANGKTSGKPGYFYIIRTGLGLLKFGSLVRVKPNDRLNDLRSYTGFAEFVVLAEVADAGAYEAIMMDTYRCHHVRGEYFDDFLIDRQKDAA